MAITTIRGGRQITDSTIPYADIQNVTANSVLGNNTASATSIQEIALASNTLLGRGSTGNITAITVSGGLSFSGSVLSSAGIGGSTGSVDNAVLRADGTGGSTVQASSISIDDSANITLGTTGLAGSSRTLTASGSATDVDIRIIPKGSSRAHLMDSTQNTYVGVQSGGIISLFTSDTSGTSKCDILLNGSSGKNSQVLVQGDFPTRIKRESSETSTPVTVFDIYTTSTGTEVAGFGASFDYILPTSTTTSGLYAQEQMIITSLGTSGSVDYRLLLKNGAGNPTERLRLISTGQLKLNAYTSSSSFSGTAAGYLAFDSSGNILTVAVPTGGGITSLGGLTVATQTFTNDTNVTITSATSTHTLGWSGQLAVSRGGTGASTLTGVLIGNGTSAVSALSSTTALQVLRVNGAGNGYEFATISTSGIGGSTGSTDNAILRADGTGGSTLQASSIILDDSANLVLGTTSLAGSSRKISAEGSASNVGIILEPKGTSSATLGFVSGNNVYASSTGSGLSVTKSGATVESSILTLDVDSINPPFARGYATIKTETGQGGVAQVLDLKTSRTSGSYLAGYGVGLTFTTETSSLNNELGSSIESVSTDLTSSSEDFDLVFRLMAGGTAGNERLRIISTGQIVLPSYTSSSSFTGTVAGHLAFTSSGNIITVSASVGGSGTTNTVPKFTASATIGDSSITDNGTTVTLTQGQLKFPVTQNGSSDANTLDDYEEGTWTPTYVPSSGAFTTLTYGSARGGRYQKIGNRVYISGILTTNSVTLGTATGDLYIGGLPFTMNSSTTAEACMVMFPRVLTWATDPPASAYALNTTQLTMYRQRDLTTDENTATINPSDMTTGAVTGANLAWFFGWYNATS